MRYYIKTKPEGNIYVAKESGQMLVPEFTEVTQAAYYQSRYTDGFDDVADFKQMNEELYQSSKTAVYSQQQESDILLNYNAGTTTGISDFKTYSNMLLSLAEDANEQIKAFVAGVRNVQVSELTDTELYTRAIAYTTEDMSVAEQTTGTAHLVSDLLNVNMSAEVDSLTTAREFNYFIISVLQAESLNYTVYQTLALASMFPAWEDKIGESLKVNDYIRRGVDEYGDPELYKVLRQHVAQANIPPETTPQNYERVGYDDETNTRYWIQPMGKEDAYDIGDVVWFEDAVYTNITANNLWAPNVFGWEVV